WLGNISASSVGGRKHVNRGGRRIGYEQPVVLGIVGNIVSAGAHRNHAGDFIGDGIDRDQIAITGSEHINLLTVAARHGPHGRVGGEQIAQGVGDRVLRHVYRVEAGNCVAAKIGCVDLRAVG